MKEYIENGIRYIETTGQESPNQKVTEDTCYLNDRGEWVICKNTIGCLLGIGFSNMEKQVYRIRLEEPKDEPGNDKEPPEPIPDRCVVDGGDCDRRTAGLCTKCPLKNPTMQEPPKPFDEEPFINNAERNTFFEEKDIHCDYCHCIAGMGLAGSGRCFLKGNAQPDCPQFGDEEKWLEERETEANQAAIVRGAPPAQTFGNIQYFQLSPKEYEEKMKRESARQRKEWKK